MKKYNQSPLPFQGQKRRFLVKFKEALNAISTENKQLVFIDLFGGSGLLSHTVKEMFLNSRVVWNDYDNYQQRLANVTATNKLLGDLRDVLNNSVNNKRIADDVKAQLLERIKNEKGFVDYITLSASLLFSGKYATNYEDLSKQTMYNTCKQTNYSTEGYLQGVERVCVDYKVLFEQYKNVPNVLFLIDPPYLSTDTASYNSDSCWKLSDYLDVLTTLQGTQYFYFTSNKSQVVELCNWVSSHSNFVNPFKGCNYQTTAGNVNYNSTYTDIMAYKI